MGMSQSGKQISAPLKAWLVDQEQHFVGAEPAPELVAAILSLAQRVASSGAAQTEEVTVAGAGGEPSAVKLSATPTGDGAVVVASLGLDDLREAEDSLYRFDMVMQATHDAVWDWNLVTGRIWWNRQQFELLGLDPDTTTAALDVWLNSIHPDDRPRMLRGVEELSASGATLTQGEYRFVRADGSVRFVMDRACIERDDSGRPRRVVGVMADVTAQRTALEALKKSEERFREMTTAVDQVFWLVNHDGSKVLYVSPAYENIWGRSREGLYSNARRFTDAIHEDDRERVKAHLPLAFAGKYNEVYRVRRPDDTIVWIHDRGFPIRDASGAVIRIAGVATDITALRQLEQQLAEAQRLESVGRLAGGIAHDFNNLLTVILSSVQMMTARLPPGVGNQDDLEAIRAAGERAARLTSQLLAFARRQVIAPAKVDLNELARQMERLLCRVIGEPIELRTVLEPRPCTVVADRAQLEQVFVNMAINARDAMPDGGRLTIETRHVALGPDGQECPAEVAPGPYAALVISDTGPGISSDALPHIFEPFFSTKPAGQGTGLGLATCYGIVRQAGGVILVDTAPGKGTTFRILLPRVDEPAASAEPPSLPRGSNGSETVLFVEDEPAVRRIGVRILAEHGYRVLEAGSAAEALQVAASHGGPIHLLMTDMVMPHMGGAELARKLLEQRPALRVLYTSGYTQSAVVEDPSDARVAFLGKPYVVETLLDKVRALLDAPAPAATEGESKGPGERQPSGARRQ